EDVLITGAGLIGSMAAAVCKHAGAKNIVVTDVNDYRLDLALRLGATRAINVTREKVSDVWRNELDMQEGFDIGLEMSGNPAGFNDILDNACNGAKVSLLGIMPDKVAISWDKIIFKGLMLKGIYGREMFETWHKMSKIVRGGMDISPMITHRLAYTDFAKGFEAMRTGNSGKVVLDWIS
ncbi:MAG: zinc-binding dehydrogenase, partial [Acinetobacter sp.]